MARAHVWEKKTISKDKKKKKNLKIKLNYIDENRLYDGTEITIIQLTCCIFSLWLLLQTWYHFSCAHILGCRYWSNVRGFGPPNQSIKKMFSISNLKKWKSWSLGQSVNHPKHINKQSVQFSSQKEWKKVGNGNRVNCLMKAEVFQVYRFLYSPFISACFENKAFLANSATSEFSSTNFNWNNTEGKFNPS